MSTSISNWPGPASDGVALPRFVAAPELDPEVSDLLLKMLAKEARDRFATYAELRAAVAAIRARRQARKHGDR